MLSVGRVMEFSAMTNATAPKSTEQISEKKTSTLAADNTDKFVQSGATFTQAYTKATVTDNRSNNTSTSTMPDSDDAIQQAKEREEREREEARVKDEPAAQEQPDVQRPLTAIMKDFVKQTVRGQVEDARKSAAERELDEILGTLSDEELDENYWNAENTAYRILGFAEELTAGNAAQFSELREAFEEGFGDSEAELGGRQNMPQVSYNTYELVQNGFDYFLKNTGTT